MARQWFGVVALVATLVLMNGPAALAQKAVLRVGLSAGDVGTLDPHRSGATQTVAITNAIFNGLVRFRPGSANPADIEPDLATSWETSKDGLTWTFRLRRGVQFHRGYGELTAEDVVYSLKKAADPKRSAFASDYAAIESVEALDRYTVRIRLKERVPSLLGLLANYHGGMILSKKAAEELGDRFALNPVGTGPFAFAEYAPQQYVRLVRHEAYFRGRPQVDEIVYRFMPDVRSRQAAFQAGELDVIEGLREQWWVDEMSRDRTAVVDVIGPGEMRTLHFNMSIKPLDDLRVRQAIAYAINLDELMTFIGKKVTIPAPSPVPPGYLGYTSDLPRYPYSLERARQLLAEAGYPNGLNLGRVVITEYDSLRRPMEVLQEQLRRAGITFDLQVVDHPTFHSLIRQNVSALVLYGAARFPVADIYLSQFYHSSAIVGKPTAVTNFSHYGEVIPGIDGLIEQARAEVDPQRQVQLWQQAQRRIMTDLPAYPLYVLQLVLVRKPYVQLGYQPESSLALFYEFNERTALRR